jgi:hypothetical protein
MTSPPPPAPDGIGGYTYGSAAVRPSPVSLAELGLLRQAAQLGPEEERWLRRAGEILVDEADALVDEWRGVIAAHPHLAAYSTGPDGHPNAAYAAASRPRFVQWVRDVCQRPYDQAWLDYQHEIGLRHTHAKKNQTDGVASAPHIPLRYVLAFAAVVITTTRRYLARHGDAAEEVEQMYDAWCKAVILHVTLWSEAYVALSDW